MAHSLAGGFGQAGMFAYIISSPRLFIEFYGIAPQHYGLLFGANAAGLIVGSQISARLLRTHTPLQLQRGAMHALAAASLALLALALDALLNTPLPMSCLEGYMFSK